MEEHEDPDEVFLTVAETAQRLRLSPTSVRRLITSGRLHASRMAIRGSTRGRWRVPLGAVRAYVKSTSQHSDEQ